MEDDEMIVAIDDATTPTVQGEVGVVSRPVEC
jgi:hypothetical protein